MMSNVHDDVMLKVNFPIVTHIEHQYKYYKFLGINFLNPKLGHTYISLYALLCMVYFIYLLFL